MTATVPVLNELMAALGGAMTQQHVDRLLELGVPAATTIICGMAKISADGAFYVPDDDGIDAVIVPCLDGEIVVDLLAFALDKPAKWWTRLGAHWALGGDALDRLWLDDRLRIHRTPINWLRGGAQPNAAVVLDWRAAAAQLLTVPGIIGDDYEHALEIEQHLKATQTIPNISFPAEARTAA